MTRFERTVRCSWSSPMAERRSKLTTRFSTEKDAGALLRSSRIPHLEESRSRDFTNGWSTVRHTLNTIGKTHDHGTLPPASRLRRVNRKVTASSFSFLIRFGPSRRRFAGNHRPVAVGVPGYVLPQDMEGRLFLRYGKAVKSLKVEPASALEIREDSSDHKNWKAYTLQGKTWGRSRLTVTYDDGTVQTIQYFVIKPSAQVVADMGHFLTTKQWFADSSDPFHRVPAPKSPTTARRIRWCCRTVVSGSRV